MVIFGSYMFEFSVSRDMEKENKEIKRKEKTMKGGGNIEGSNPTISNTNRQRIEN